MGIHSFSIIFIYAIPLAVASTLIITNDAPITLGATVKFHVLLDYVPEHSLTYTFDDGVEHHMVNTMKTNYSYSMVCTPELYQERHYTLFVTVKEYGFFWDKPVAANNSNFFVTNDIVGSIRIVEGNGTQDLDEIAVGKIATIQLSIHDPSDYFKNAKFDYSWNIDGERHLTLSDNKIDQNFTDAGDKDIKAIVTASLPNQVFKFGFFERTLQVKIPVNNVNATGNFFHHHGEMFHLNISCGGSPPFEYCSQFLSANESSENFTCRLSTFTNCNFYISHYFQNYGTYNIAIFISNDVEIVRRVYEIMVYNVSTKPTLSTIIIPIVCSLLALCIIAGGISYCIQRRNHLAVEVANFDFQDDSDSYTERTFFERIFDPFSCRTCHQDYLCGGGDSDSVVNEQDPLLFNQPLVRV